MDDVQLAVLLTIDRTGAVKYSAIDHDDRDIDRVVALLLSLGLIAMDPTKEVAAAGLPMQLTRPRPGAARPGVRQFHRRVKSGVAGTGNVGGQGSSATRAGLALRHRGRRGFQSLSPGHSLPVGHWSAHTTRWCCIPTST